MKSYRNCVYCGKGFSTEVKLRAFEPSKTKEEEV